MKPFSNKLYRSKESELLNPYFMLKFPLKQQNNFIKVWRRDATRHNLKKIVPKYSVKT